MTEDGLTPDEDWRVDTAYWPGPDAAPFIGWHDNLNAISISMEEASRVMHSFGRAVGRLSIQTEAIEALCKAYGIDPKQTVFHHRFDPDRPTPEKRKEGALRWASRSRSFPTSRQPWERRRR